MTQEELPEKTRANRVTIARYEAGAFLPSVPAIHAIADALGVSVAELSGAEEASTKPQISDEDVKIALWGERAEEITPQQFNELKQFAQFIVSREDGKHD